MHEKQGFLKLENRLQDRLRYFMTFLALLQILTFLITLETTNLISIIIGVSLNLFILYFSFSIKRAPNLYFQLITWVFWMVVIFNGLEIFWVISGQQALSFKSIPSFLSVVLVIAIAPTLMKYRKAIDRSKEVKIAA